MSVILNKIDVKMIYGKITNNFGRFLGADEYIVVNDEIINDEEKLDLMQLLIPAGSQFDAVSCKTYAKIFHENDYYGSKTIVIFRSLVDVMSCLELGVKFEKINCAGIYSESAEVVEYEKMLVLSSDDFEKLRLLHSLGVELVYQPTVQEKELAVSNLLKL